MPCTDGLDRRGGVLPALGCFPFHPWHCSVICECVHADIAVNDIGHFFGDRGSIVNNCPVKDILICVGIFMNASTCIKDDTQFSLVL